MVARWTRGGELILRVLIASGRLQSSIGSTVAVSKHTFYINKRLRFSLCIGLKKSNCIFLQSLNKVAVILLPLKHFITGRRLTGAVARAGINPIVTNNDICGEPVTAEQAAPRGGIIEFKCDPPVRARYVFVDIPIAKLAILQLCEVTVKEFPLEVCSPNRQ